MITLSELEIRRAAFHEAGHAVVSVCLGVPFDYVRIDQNGSGGLYLPDNGDTAYGEVIELARKQVVVAYAGAAAQRLFYPDQPEHEITQCSEDDRQKIMNIAIDFPDIEVGKPAKSRAKSAVSELRDTIRKTAEVLLEKKNLTFQDVQNIYTSLGSEKL